MDRAALRRLQRDKGDTAGIWIATPHPGHVDGHYHDSVVNTLLYDAHNGQRIVKWGCVCTMETSPRIASARNDMVEEVYDRMLEIMKWPELMDEFEITMTVPIEADGDIGPWGKGISIDKAKEVAKIQSLSLPKLLNRMTVPQIYEKWKEAA